MKKYIISGCVILLLVIFWACAQAPQKQFYLISYVPTKVSVENSARPYPFKVQLREFDVLRVYNRSQMVLRFSPNQIQYYNFKHWAVRPGFMITDAIEKHLTTANLVTELRRDFLDYRPDYQIIGTVGAIERFDSGDTWYAHLAMNFKLLRERDRHELWNYSFDRRKRVYNPDVVYTVEALSEILDSEMRRVIRDLDRIFYQIAQNEGIELDPQNKPDDTQIPVSSSTDQFMSPSIRIYSPETPDTLKNESTYELIPAKNLKTDEDSTKHHLLPSSE